MDGEWSGTAEGANAETGRVVLELQQEGDEITGGSGELREDEASGGVGVTIEVNDGSVSDDGEVAMNAVTDGTQQVRLTGTLADDRLDLTLTTQTGAEIPLSLTRES